MVLGKRKTKTNQVKPSSKNKKPKSADASQAKPKKTKGKTKQFIEIPGLSSSRSTDCEETGDDTRAISALDIESSSDDQDLMDEEVDLGEEAMIFLKGLDQKGITRSSKEQKLENRKNRPKDPSSSTSKSYKLLPKISNQNLDEEDENLDDLDDDDLALGSGDDDDIDLLSDMPSSGSGKSFSDFDDDSTDFDSEDGYYSTDNSLLEEAYYAKRNKRASSEGSSVLEPTESKLPILHPDGKIQRFPKPLPADSSRVVKSKSSGHSQADQQSEEQPTKSKRTKPSDPSLGARFGRKPLSEILSSDLSFQNRIQCAKLEIAGLAQEAISDPEMSLGSLKRILAMSCPTLNQPHENPENRNLKIDSPIRMMSILSLLAIFLDIIPGYRIRPITEAEKQAKVSQMVARQREWEEGLVSIYRRYLEICEKEVTKNTPLSACCLKSLCTLLQSKTHFNFSHNIMHIIVRKLGQREWDELSLECAETITAVFKKDVKGDDSLQLVKLIVRTIKSRNYSVHPELLQVILSLRLKNELSSHIRASNDRVYSTKDQLSTNQRSGKLPWKDRAAHQKSKSSGTQQPAIISKKARKIMKARAGIEEEIAEAEETVKVEEKERNQTETLKMMFGCYFRIIKLPYRSALLPVALEGFSRFAHLVNIDFFRDLLEVLRKHINGTAFDESEPDPADLKNDEQPVHQKKYNRNEYRDKLLCIVTAFELLSGQGEALNLDLTDIINSFYGLLLDISTLIKLEEDDEGRDRKENRERKTKDTNHEAKSSDRNLRSSTSEMVIKVLDLIFFNRSDPPTPNRAILFTKRLLTISLTCSDPQLTLKLLKFLSKLTTRQPVIKNLFKICPATDHARRDPLEEEELESSIDQLGWELFLLRNHWDHRVQISVRNLIQS
ncbi:hypothetical protein PTTG_06344 [Puccinia triticina 1-1 BBBD Race 1]|uniref:Nucleolar complex-associated protein 3 n=2 Tax=Puccinia triticina TaxID=208348 RepID=A0A180G9I2_PUCT1|nr:uncharacterized protein PtA15_14A16 [Puccinia triticina]OAV88563.1 hypothetical protein PTTG_06344 [Puccinia triticina 1-1 BBBD Race 1]WAQ91136.1 hypothetical protein PtA15_14A16 [Puccinia triticina]WAR61928.1 hypothetical protein PtB15_14B19 [Puccinia triticina]